MGIIENGTVSGHLPSEEAFAIHYPAYPSSMDRAIETLGGADAIVKARSSELNKLELRFRPEDPYSHPAFGQLNTCNHFLLKISKKRVRNAHHTEVRNGVLSSSSAVPVTLKQKDTCSDLAGACGPSGGAETENIAKPAGLESQVLEEEQVHLVADPIARLREAYHFNGMVDYQHVVAVHADVALRKKRNWMDFEKCGLMDVEQEDLMILLPPLFSLKDIPERVALRPCASSSSKKRQMGVVQQHWEMEIEPSLALDFNIKEIPKKVNWEKYVPGDSEQWSWQKAVCEMFEERPIWVKDSLSERLLDKGLEFGGIMLRRLLFRAAYYFSNGPFLRFWIRKGYDPRKDPGSRIYQRTDFRLPPPLRNYSDANAASRLTHRWEDICAFRTFPYKCQTSLQLVELADDYIQQEIRKPSSLAECDCVTGWFPSHVLDSFRRCIAVRFLSIYPKAGAGPLLKSASIRFEKSKKVNIYPKHSKVSEEGEQVNREVVEDQEMDFNDDEDDEEDEDEVEDDNIEGDLDADVIGHQEGNFSPQQHSSTDPENVSRNYLQELFGSFPFNAAGDNERPDFNNSDGEYQIYEESSDGNYSDVAFT